MIDDGSGSFANEIRNAKTLDQNSQSSETLVSNMMIDEIPPPGEDVVRVGGDDVAELFVLDVVSHGYKRGVGSITAVD